MVRFGVRAARRRHPERHVHGTGYHLHGRQAVATQLAPTESRAANVNTAIQDEFSALPISRQRKYQLRRARDGRCTQCGERVVAGKRCLKHLIEARERQRQVQGTRRRYYNTLSYKLEAPY